MKTYKSSLTPLQRHQISNRLRRIPRRVIQLNKEIEWKEAQAEKATPKKVADVSLELKQIHDLQSRQVELAEIAQGR